MRLEKRVFAGRWGHGCESTELAKLRVMSATFQAGLEPILNGFSGQIGFKAVRITDGFALERDASTVFPAASVMKVWLMIVALQQVQAGSLELQMRIPLTSDERVGGSGVLMRLEGGAELTLLDYINLMIVVSDNTATNIVLETIGGSDAVNKNLQAWGANHTTVVGKLMLPFEKKNDDQKAGKLAEIREYNLNDVRVTRKVYERMIACFGR